jgi:hypothetical protein
MAHFKARFPAYVRIQAQKLAPLKASAKIASFYAGDWLAHVDAAIAKGAGVLAYPPTYKGGYERMFRFINDNVAWTPPPYAIWNPDDMGQVVAKLEASDSPYFVYSDQKLDGFAPTIELEQKGAHKVYGYTRGKRAAYLAAARGEGEPFAYVLLDPSKLTEKSIVHLVKTSGKRMTFLKNVYLKHTILHANGRVNVLVYCDGMLAGGIVYNPLEGRLANRGWGHSCCPISRRPGKGALPS